MVSAHHRHQEIISLLSPTGRVGVGMLAEHFHVTSETIRRDLRSLEDRGLVERVHGGAIPPQNISTRTATGLSGGSIAIPDHPPTPALLALAHAAATLIQPGTRSIFLDSGPAAISLAGILASMYEKHNWTVVTTSPGAGIILARAGMPRIGMVGGRLSTQSQSLTGPRAVAMITALRADIAFLCPDGIIEYQSLTSIDPHAGATRRAMLTHAGTTVCLTPAAGLEQHRGTVFGDIAEVDVVVTDCAVSDPAFIFLSAHDHLQVVTP
ncbi:MAG: DeoR/GlpR transcriptional regulator [Corynebacterium sp.]|nr:DeoR/GlpR transcriptional regulator [Corynebacterium sp.]